MFGVGGNYFTRVALIGIGNFDRTAAGSLHCGHFSNQTDHKSMNHSSKNLKHKEREAAQSGQRGPNP